MKNAFLFCLCAGLLLCTPSAFAVEEVRLVGLMGSRALIAIDGRTPKPMRAGESQAGIKVLSVGSASVEVEVDGQRQVLRVGQSFGGGGSGMSMEDPLVLRLDTYVYPYGGMSPSSFFAKGRINDRPVHFEVLPGMAFKVQLEYQSALRLVSRHTLDEAGCVSPDKLKPGRRNRDCDIWLDTLQFGMLTLRDVPAQVLCRPKPNIQEAEVARVFLGRYFLNQHFEVSPTLLRDLGDTLTLRKKTSPQ
jgi:hypothetical protein